MNDFLTPGALSRTGTPAFRRLRTPGRLGNTRGGPIRLNRAARSAIYGGEKKGRNRGSADHVAEIVAKGRIGRWPFFFAGSIIFLIFADNVGVVARLYGLCKFSISPMPRSTTNSVFLRHFSSSYCTYLIFCILAKCVKLSRGLKSSSKTGRWPYGVCLGIWWSASCVWDETRGRSTCFLTLILETFFQLENIDNSALLRLVQSVRVLDDNPTPTQTITHGQKTLSELSGELLGLIQFVKTRKR